MPRYEYKCEGCGEVFELQQKFADEPLTVHEKCGGRVERIISAPALMFKGSGFYVNDYAKGGGNGGSKKSEGDSKPDSKPATDTAAKSDTKSTESKPAPASTDKSKSD
ncbi:MAG: FmdB family zinc ribbon protein [Bryobacteraceae bacterium]|jgi:putative FmdB family regulatory protein